MKVKAAHHTAADSKEMRTAMPSVRPNVSWKLTSTKLSASSNPPPA